MSINKILHPIGKLFIGSKYFRYHLKMYIETIIWLNKNSQPSSWNTEWNAILEDHLVHARVLINFLTKTSGRNTDVLAIHYFGDQRENFKPLNSEFLNSQVEDIGNHLVHITTSSMPDLKSQQTWLTKEIAISLIPAIGSFLVIVPQTGLADGVKNDCLNYLAQLPLDSVPVSLNSAT